jgi:tetratricopeptide (TPR) repeat protein
MIELSSRQRDLFICLCLVLATTVVYWPAQRLGFTNYDDGEYVYENPHVVGGLTLKNLAWAFSTFHASNWHPLTWVSHMLDCQWFGLDPGGHHLINALFHIANTLLLFGVLNRMTVAPWRSAFVAALFALHPLHVESVAWVAERKDVLSMFFGLLTIAAYGRYVEKFAVHGRAAVPRGHPRTRSSTSRPPTTDMPQHVPTDDNRPRRSAALPPMDYALTLLFFALGLMAKPMAVTLPFVLLLLDYWPLGRTRLAGAAGGKGQGISLARLFKEKLPFFALAAASSVVTCFAQRRAVLPLDRLSIGDRMANAVVSYVRYLGNALWPENLAAFYPQQRWTATAVLGAIAVLVLVTVVATLKARREPHFIVGWLWYLGTLVPVIGLVQVGSQSMADRYTYLPLVGVFVMVAWAVPGHAVERRTGRRIVAVLAVLLLSVCAVLSRRQLGYWRSGVTLFGHAVAVTKDNFVASYDLGSALLNEGRPEEAVGQFKQALQIKPRNAEAHFKLGFALALLGRLSEAAAHYQESLRLKPNDAARQYGLANLLRSLGRVPEAIGHYEQAVRLKPDFAEAHFNLGLVLSQAGRIDDAIAQFEQALKLKPDYAEAHFNLGLALEQTGRIREAMNSYEQALQSNPRFIGARNNLAWLLATLAPAEGGDPARAVTMAERLCKATGHRVAPYLDTLAAAYAAAGRFTDAIATALKAIEVARLSGQVGVAEEIETRLELYRGGHVYRRLSTSDRNGSVDGAGPHG